MPVRIAFAACSQFQRDPVQEVWNEIAMHQPDHLLLLGDQIYMDYLGDGAIRPDGKDIPIGFVGYGLGDPARLDAATFETQMRLRYRQQFGIASFRALVHAVGQRGTVAMVWDDHDFGFNNALGARGGPQDVLYADRLIPSALKAVSRRLFEEFSRSVQALCADASATYFDPPLPADWQPPLGAETVHSRHRLGPVELFMLDTRSCRQSPARRDDTRDASILGAAQWRWLRDGLEADGAPLAVIASGSTFSSSGLLSDQSWKQARGGHLQPYREYAELLAVATRRYPHKRMLFIGGDRHDIDIIEDHPALPELVCAGSAATKPGRDGRHFGLLELDDEARGGARLFTRGKERLRWSTHPGQPATWSSSRGSLFLVTNRVVRDGKATDEISDWVRHYRFDGNGLDERAAQFGNWREVPHASVFWTEVETAMREQAMRHPLRPNQICLFVPGNRKTNEEVIDRLRVLASIAFNPQGEGCLGCAIAFDWATEWSALPLPSNYEHNIHRARKAAPLLSEQLVHARRAADAASALLTVCAHSLGNRVVLEALSIDWEGAPKLDRWLANAADLDRRVFCTPQGKAALRRCTAVLVSFTRLDGELWYAERQEFDRSCRMGRHSPADLAKLPADLQARLHYLDVSSLVSPHDAHSCLFQQPWPGPHSAGPLQSAVANAMALGCWA